MNRFTVYPVEGRVVPDPDAGDYLPEAGREVPRSMYWLRRERAGDVTTEAPTKAKAAAKSTAGSAE